MYNNNIIISILVFLPHGPYFPVESLHGSQDHLKPPDVEKILWWTISQAKSQFGVFCPIFLSDGVL